MDIEILKTLFADWSGLEVKSCSALPISGSDRRYFRLVNGQLSVLGVFNPYVKENKAYYSFTKYFLTFDIPVPKVEKISADKLYYLVEDLGDDSLYNRVIACNGHLTDDVIELYKKSLKQLIKMQVKAGKTMDYTHAYPVEKFDSDAIQWDLNYFKYNFLKLSGIDFNEYLLEKDFKTLKRFLLDVPMGFFMFRDFQSRNIMIRKNEPYFIDFQSGREGPITYDVASLLYQAKAQIPNKLRNELFDYYFEELSKVLTVNYQQQRNSFKGFALLRILQVLGAYGFRGYFEKKQHFIDSIPFAISNLNDLLFGEHFPIALPYLREISQKLNDSVNGTNLEPEVLTIRISSFSYRKGIPVDPSGNGGGFVFDCRGILNPGRLKEYQTLTGKDEPVKKFFTEKTDIEDFAGKINELVTPTINTYIERGFKHLMVSFGCTGGQHRSVYCAETFAKYVTNNFKVKVVLWHREQGELITYE